MINMRLKFTKGKENKYISHLDLMRTFQRALRRSHIPMHYSKGFNPHPSMSFASALGIGLTSIGEYIDIVLDEEIPVKDLVARLNDNLPKGIKVTDGVILLDKAKSAMSIVNYARYNIFLKLNRQMDAEKLLLDFIAQDSIRIYKRKPKNNFQLVETDIKPMIKEAKVLRQEGSNAVIDCILACGSKSNLKPQLLAEAFKKYADDDLEVVGIERIELFAYVEDKIVPLLMVDNK